ncbi:MAG: hypothetical protein ACRELB_22530, partial [Polyangiaceae bacterium]
MGAVEATPTPAAGTFPAAGLASRAPYFTIIEIGVLQSPSPVLVTVLYRNSTVDSGTSPVTV